MYIADKIIKAFDENNVKYRYKEQKEYDNHYVYFLFEDIKIPIKHLINYNLVKLNIRLSTDFIRKDGYDEYLTVHNPGEYGKEGIHRASNSEILGYEGDFITLIDKR